MNQSLSQLRSRIMGYCIIALLLIMSGSSFAQTKSNSLWNDVRESDIKASGIRYIIPQKYRALSLTFEETRKYLLTAPMENTPGAFSQRIVLAIPMPDGTTKEYYVTESPIMAPELAAQFPELKTYSIEAKDCDAGNGRIDCTPLGFHAMIFIPEGTVFIDPYRFGDHDYYISYYKSDYFNPAKAIHNGNCVIDDPAVDEEIHRLIAQGRDKAPGNQLRTYRLALAADGEYTAYYGGTVAGAMNGIVTSMNRVNAVYINELAIKMVLVANNSSIIYTNSSTDPYTNSNGSAMLSQNQTTCDNIIGAANYDIGHVFSTGGGGVAMLGAVCRSGYKAQGVTGSPAPVGDPYDIDYVAHEMGHQYGANHSFNSQMSSCGGGNRNASTAYEPGSGSTIMAYAGICSSDDLQPHSDPYFHIVNLNEMVAYTTSGSGSSCPVVTATGNNPPTVSVPTGGFTIPKSTPFELTGSATDPEGDALTYCWEEYDLGSAGSPGSPSGNAPIFRSFNPVASPTRIFPKLTNLLNNSYTIGELLPTYARTLTFRCVVRDNRAGGAGFGYAQMQFSVSGTAGPFTVTAPNTAVSWQGGSQQTVTWNVAGTDASPISCANVKILLSTDGGNTWGVTLAASTPNDGSETVTIPNTPVSTARIKVAAVGNVFFDISNVNFTITPGGSATTVGLALTTGWNLVSIPVNAADMSASALFPQTNSLVYGFNNGYSAQTTLTTGKGYWVKYPNDAQVSITGLATGLTTVPLLSGWNMFGAYNNNITVANLTTTPAGIINSLVYGFDNGYTSAATLLPGKGYWVRTTAAGALNLGTTSAKTNSILSAPENYSSKIIVTDATGSSMTLYGTIAAQNGFDLPPVPPSGIFDVRFDGDKLAEVISSVKDIRISGAVYPITVRVDGSAVTIRDKATSGKIFNQSVNSGQSVQIKNSSVNVLEVIVSAKPVSYELSQNYPNPFNPSTVISYQIPMNSLVTLKVYDAIGTEVATLVNSHQESGSYNVTFDASKLNSGVYFYTLRSGDFSATRKLILVK